MFSSTRSLTVRPREAKSGPKAGGRQLPSLGLDERQIESTRTAYHCARCEGR
jgi:hypothetical protein